MSHIPRLSEPLKAYRIGDPLGEFPLWSDGGARLVSGRWHVAGDPVIYASEHYSTAMLEKLVHYHGHLPCHQHFVELTIPAGISYQVVSKDHLPGWCDPDLSISQRFGSDWQHQGSSALLIVPSVVARMERNIVFNTRHEEFKRIQVGLETPVWWDGRLFGAPG